MGTVKGNGYRAAKLMLKKGKGLDLGMVGRGKEGCRGQWHHRVVASLKTVLQPIGGENKEGHNYFFSMSLEKEREELDLRHGR